MLLVRETAEGDIAAVLSLYTHLHDADEKADDRALQAASRDIFADPRTHLSLLEYGGVPVSTCALHILPNLTRSAIHRRGCSPRKKRTRGKNPPTGIPAAEYPSAARP